MQNNINKSEKIAKCTMVEAMKFLYDEFIPRTNIRTRYFVAYGGRGAGKSRSVSNYIITRMLQIRTRVVCGREIQKSIKESVHRLLVNSIETMGVSDSFTITEDSIKCVNGSEAIFVGLFRNVHNVKSLEDCDVLWIEEAENVSEDTYITLQPTVRNENSIIIITMNTRYMDDPTYVRFIAKPPINCITRKINYTDNAFFPKVLQLEMEADKLRDPDLYKHVWLGEPLLTGSRIWPDFDKLVHVKHWDLRELKDKANFFMSIDPHSAYYPAIIWGCTFPKPGARSWPEDYYKYVYAEWPTREDVGGDYCDLRKKLYFSGDLKDLAKVIYTRDGTAEYGITIKKRFVDTRYAKAAGGTNWTTSTHGLISTWAKRENGGIVLDQPAESTMSSIKSTIVAELRYNKLMPIGNYNEPTLYIDPSCTNLIQSLTNHRCMEGKETEDEKYKDFSDALKILRSGLVDNPWRDPVKKIKASNYDPDYIVIGSNDNKKSNNWMGS
jgi:hypothetical protein